MMAGIRKHLRARHADDVLPGDFVRRVGQRGVGLVESVADGHATVAWNKDVRDILPFALLRRVRNRGSTFDRRGPLA